MHTFSLTRTHVCAYTHFVSRAQFLTISHTCIHSLYLSHTHTHTPASPGLCSLGPCSVLLPSQSHLSQQFDESDLLGSAVVPNPECYHSAESCIGLGDRLSPCRTQLISMFSTQKHRPCLFLKNLGVFDPWAVMVFVLSARACFLRSQSHWDCGQRHCHLYAPGVRATVSLIWGMSLPFPSRTHSRESGSRFSPGSEHRLGMGSGGWRGWCWRGCHHPGPSWHGVSELHIHAGNHSLAPDVISFPRI